MHYNFTFKSQIPFEEVVFHMPMGTLAYPIFRYQLNQLQLLMCVVYSLLLFLLYPKSV